MCACAEGRSHHPAQEEAGPPVIRFHDLRYTAATLLLLQGISAKIVADMLGRSTVPVTLDRYSHVPPSMRRAAADAMAKALDGR